MINKSLLLKLGALLLSGLIVYWFVQKMSSTGKKSPGRSQSPFRTAEGDSLVDQEVARQVTAIEAEQRQLDETVWAKELLAEKHEAIFIKLWDDLRTNEDSFSVFEKFAFGELLLGTAAGPVSGENGISEAHFGKPIQSLTADSWRQLLTKLKQQSYWLEQSEWRHPQFAASSNETTHSVIAMTLHVVNRAKVERFIVRGHLRIQWKRPAQPNDEPFPELIDATDLEMLSRQGETPFEHKIVADITPEQLDRRFLEPSLHLYDLDGDGLSEIIFPRLNLVFWNQGKGKFRKEKLCEESLATVNAGLFADFDGDGRADFLAADSRGLVLFHGDEHGHFTQPAKRVWLSEHDLPNPFVITAGDIDGDGDLDVWLAQYKVPYQNGQMPTPYFSANDGFPSFLLVNDGHGNFQDRTETAGLAAKRFHRTYSCSFVDLDNDGDLDLVVVSDFAGVDAYLNDGRGHFTDVTRQMLDEPHAFGMSHVSGDFDSDGKLDLLMIGMNSYAANRLEHLQLGRPGFAEHQQMRAKMGYGNRLYFQRDGRFEQTALSDQIAHTGWSWGVAAGDFDNDGDLDIYVVNGHISGQTAKDYDTQFWRHDIYMGSSRDDPMLERYFRANQTRHQGAGESYGGFEKNRLFLNHSGKSFLETGYLLGVALEEDCRNVECDDLDGNGKLELLATTIKVSPQIKQELHLFPNFTETVGNWIGVRLRESGPGFSPVGAKVTLTTAAGRQIRQVVTGESYRSQHATTAHFGIGGLSQVESVEVTWPNGRRQIVSKPEINRYHLILPGRDR